MCNFRDISFESQLFNYTRSLKTFLKKAKWAIDPPTILCVGCRTLALGIRRGRS